VNTEEASVIVDAIMNLENILKISGAVLIGFIDCLLVGFSVALMVVGVKLRKSNQIADRLKVNLDYFKEEQVHIIKRETLRRK